MKRLFKKFKKIIMNTIHINGVSYDNVAGKNITIINDKVIVDGVVIKDGLSGIVKIKFEGDIANLNATNVEVNGNIQGDIKGTNITCGNIGGNVKGTNITCGNIGGDVEAVRVNRK